MSRSRSPRDRVTPSLDLTGANAPSSGVPTDVLHYSQHDAGQHFAEFVRSQLSDVDGLLYDSRFTGRRSVAVFDHAVSMLVAVDTQDLDQTLVHAALHPWNITVR